MKVLTLATVAAGTLWATHVVALGDPTQFHMFTMAVGWAIIAFIAGEAWEEFKIGMGYIEHQKKI